MKMLRIVVGYRGGDRAIDLGIAELYNTCRSIDISWYARRSDISDVKVMFESTWFDPQEFALVFMGSRVVGLGWAWELPRTNRIAMCVDSRLPIGIVEECTRSILGWARHSFESRGIRGVVRISAWCEYGYLHRVLKHVLDGAPYIETTWGTLMVFRGFERKYELPKGYRVRIASVDDIPRIVDVVNRAFSVYDWFEAWNPEDIRKYYEKYGYTMLVVENDVGDIVGYVDFEVFEAVDGSKTGIVGTLAVDPCYQRRGIGRALLSIAVEMLRSRGAERIILDGVSGLEPLYRKLGFVEYRRWALLITPMSALPTLSTPIEKLC